MKNKKKISSLTIFIIFTLLSVFILFEKSLASIKPEKFLNKPDQIKQKNFLSSKSNKKTKSNKNSPSYIVIATLSILEENNNLQKEKTSHYYLIKSSQENLFFLRKHNSDQKIQWKKIPEELAFSLRSNILSYVWTSKYRNQRIEEAQCSSIGEVKIITTKDQIKVCHEDIKSYEKFISIEQKLANYLK